MNDDAQGLKMMLSASLALAKSPEEVRLYKKLLDKVVRFIENLVATIELLEKCTGTNSIKVFRYVVGIMLVFGIMGAVGFLVNSASAVCGPLALVCAIAIDVLAASVLLDIANDMLKTEKENILAECE